MAISNGYDETQVYNALKTRRGWQQPTLSGVPTLDTANKACDSGKYYEDAHQACNINYLYKTQEDYTASDAEFNAYLTGTERANINASIASVFAKPSVIDKPKLLHERSERSTKQYVTNSGKFVGVKLWLSPGDFAAQIHSAALLFDGEATFNLHLFSDLKKNPIWSQEVTSVANDLTIIPIRTVVTGEGDDAVTTIEEAVLRPLDASTKGGTFYLGYYQSELGSVRAIDYSCEYSCFSPLGFEYIEASTDEDFGFDRDNYSCTTRTYGLNLQVSTYRDYTQTIVSRVQEFDDLLGLHMAARCIRTIHDSIRINSTETILKERAVTWYAELRQNFATEGMPFSDSIEKKITREVTRLQDSFYPKPQPQVVTP